MANPIEEERLKLQELVDLLEDSRQALENAGQAFDTVADLIERVNLALENTGAVLPNVKEIEKAITTIKSGGGVGNLGPTIGNVQGLHQAAKGFQLFEKTLGEVRIDKINQISNEVDALNEVDLEDLVEELRKITNQKYPTDQIKGMVDILGELHTSGSLTGKQTEFIADLDDALKQVQVGWTKAKDVLIQLSDVDLAKLATEYKKLADTELDEAAILRFLQNGEDAANSAYIQLSTLQKAIVNLKATSDTEIKVIEPVDLEDTTNLIKELEITISRMSKAELSKLSSEFAKISGVELPVKEIKDFVTNLESIVKASPSQAIIGEGLLKSIESLRDIGEIPQSVSELGKQIKLLSDADLSKLSIEFKDLTKADFPVENIKAFADSLSKLEVSGAGPLKTVSELEKALSILTDSSPIMTQQIRDVGQELSKLGDINLQRLIEEYKQITKVSDFPVDDLKTFLDLIKDLESRDIISDQDIQKVKDLRQAFTNLGLNAQTLPFDQLTSSYTGGSAQIDEYLGKLDALQGGLDRASNGAGEFALELIYLKDTLPTLSLTDDAVSKIIEHFKELKSIESPAQLFKELGELGLPEEEIKTFAKGLLTLRANSEHIVKLAADLRDIGAEKETIKEIVTEFVHYESVLKSLTNTYSQTAQGAETFRISLKTASTGLSKNFAFNIDEETRKLVNFKEEVDDVIPAVERFKAVFAAQGVPTSTIDQLAGETFGQGATDFGKVAIADVGDNLTQYTTTVKYGEDATKKLVVVIDDAGRAFRSLSEATATNPLEDFITALNSLDVPTKAIYDIVGETFGKGNELQNVRISELNDEYTKLTANIKAAGGVTKAYIAYIDEMGNVLHRLPVEEVNVSMTDFVDQLSGRVGAIDNVNKMLDKYGFKLSQLKKMETEASTEITKLVFEMDKQGGATEKLTLHVTEFGKVLTDTQRRFRTFAGGIARNVGESLKWAVAITAVYGPLRKLQDLVQISIDNESKLADIGIVLGKTTAEIQQVFTESVKAARLTGESLNGVIEGYSLAYRATGKYATEAERAEVANKLLIDSLVLSKLSTLDQAEAMDTLVAGLEQAGYELDQGAELLNKWVAVSKAANVTVDTLATSFAIMATAAEGVGLSFDELNAIVAVVAANTELSATQAGNAVRAFVSGFQSDNAVQELAKFGIAVTDLNGDARDFMTVMYDIKELMDAGLIDDAELNRIGTALGGRGARRGAQFTAFLKALEDVQGLVTVSAEAQGDAYDALGIKMDTVQTSLTNLATSFQELANTLGTEGGVLDLAKLFVDYLDKIVQGVSTFISLMGKAAPLLAVGGGLLAYGASTGRLRNIPQQFGTAVTGMAGRLGLGQGPAPNPMPISDYQNFSIYGNTMATSWGKTAAAKAPMIGGYIAEGMLAILNIADKDWDGLGGQIAGGILGAPFGPIGMIIGSTVVEAIVNGLSDAGTSGELADAFKGAFAETEPRTPDPDQTTEERLLAEQDRINKEIQRTLGPEWIAGIKLFGTTADDFVRDLFGMPKKWAEGLNASQFAGQGLEQIINAYKTGGAGAARGAADEINLTGFEAWVSDEDVAKRVAYFEELQQAAKDTLEELDALSKGKPLPDSQLDTELTANMREYGDLLKNEIKIAQDEFNTQLIEGDITLKQYRDSMERMGQEGEAIMTVFSALDDVMGNNEKVLVDILHVLSRTSSEEINMITVLTTTIGDLKEQLDELEKSGDITLKIQVQEDLANAQFQLEGIFNQLEEAQRQPLLQPAFTAAQVVDFAPSEFTKVADEAGRLLQERLNEYIRLGLLPDNTTIEEVKAAGEITAIAYAEPWGDAVYESVSSAIAALLGEAAEKLRLTEEIEPVRPEPSRFRIQQVDMTQGAFMANYERQLAFLKEAFGQYWQPSLETMGIIFSDGVDVLHLDNLAMQLAMNDLIDVNQKQLEGVYNLPTDSSFYVPFQGYKLGFGEGGGGAAGGLSGAADELKEAARELKSLDPGEDWGQSFDAVMNEWFGAQKADRPTTFEAFYPRFEVPTYGPEYTPPDYGAALIGGEKNLEDYLRPALIGGEKNLEDYAYKQETSVDKFDESVNQFNKDVIEFGAQLEREMEIMRTATADDPTRGRVIGAGSSAPPAIPAKGATPVFPYATEVGENVGFLQYLAQSLVQGSENFWQGVANSIVQYIPNLLGKSPVGGGAGIGPELSFGKLDSAADKLSNFADIMKPTYEYQMLGPQQQVGTSDLATDFSGMLDLLNQKISNLSGFTTNLKISSNYTANLIVDGRTLAQVIKPYLYTDLIRFEDSASSVTKSIVA